MVGHSIVPNSGAHVTSPVVWSQLLFLLCCHKLSVFKSFARGSNETGVHLLNAVNIYAICQLVVATRCKAYTKIEMWELLPFNCILDSISNE